MNDNKPDEPLTVEPFKRGEIVICDLDYLTVRRGEKVRILECTRASDCESGWLITATNRTRGKLASNAPIAIQGVDAGWFRRTSNE